MTRLTEISKGFFIAPDFIEPFKSIGLTDIDSIFDFKAGENLHKDNLAGYRSRIMFSLGENDSRLFLKRYEKVPKFRQIKNWIEHKGRKSTMAYDMDPAEKLRSLGVSTPRTVACGQRWSHFFEQRSFVITEQVPNALSLEKFLPRYCYGKSLDDVQRKRKFIESLADFAREFHATGFRHRDFYLCHIFFSDDGKFTLIDLNRAFQPIFLAQRYRVKDIAQLYYSSPGSVFSRADRLRFYLRYSGRSRLCGRDRRFIKKVKAKANRMAKHDLNHSREVPFAK